MPPTTMACASAASCPAAPKAREPTVQQVRNLLHVGEQHEERQLEMPYVFGIVGRVVRRRLRRAAELVQAFSHCGARHAGVRVPVRIEAAVL